MKCITPRLAILIAAATVAGCAGTARPGTPVPAAQLTAIDSVLSTPPLHRAQWGIAVTDAGSGQPVFQHNVDKLFITASNMKLVTVAAALALLGPDYRFVTEVIAPLGVDGEAEHLVVRGGGDPTFSVSFHDRARAPLDSLADSLVAAGLRRVSGPIVVETGRFEPPLVHPAWEVFDLDWYYGAPVAAFAIAEGAVPVVVHPSLPGAPATVEVLELADLVGVDARILTEAGDRGWNDELRRHPDVDSLTLRGTIGAGAGADTSWIAQTDPARLAGRALVAALERAGVEVDGAVVVREDPADAAPGTVTAGEDGSARAAWRAAPLVEIIHLPLTESDNWVTEQLLKTIGAEARGEGSWSAGTAAVESFLTDTVGAEPGSLYMRDGSGLTAQNLVTPAALVALLRYVETRPWGHAYREALAQPGLEGGTLEERLLGHRGLIAAKTGSIRHVNALSGYATTADGREVVFSILSNASGVSSSAVRSGIDRILELLLEGSEP